MGSFADAFDAELAAPTDILKTAGLASTFRAEAAAAGPALAVGGAVPGAIQAYKGYSAMDEPVPEYDEQGQWIPPEKRHVAKKKRNKQLSGEVGAGVGSAVGALAPFVMPLASMNPIAAGAVALGSSMGGGWLGRQIGESAGS